KRADTSNVFIIAVVVFALTFIVAGRLQDKFGPFKISIIGAILVSLGFFLCSQADSLTKFFVFFGVLGGLGNGFGYATPIPVMSKWFPDKRGLAVGLAVAGYGGGSAIFGPLAASYLIPHYGWRTPLAARLVSWSLASWCPSLRAWAYPAPPWLPLAWWWARQETPWAASSPVGCRTTWAAS